jgi:Viral BACON domain
MRCTNFYGKRFSPGAMEVAMFKTLKISFARYCAEKTIHYITIFWRNFTSSNSLIKGQVNAKTSRFFNLSAIALISVLSLQLTACGSTSVAQRSNQTPPQITSPTPTPEATHTPTPAITRGTSHVSTPASTQSPTPTPASKPTPTPTRVFKPKPTPTPTLIPSDSTAFVVHQDGGQLSFPIDGSFAPQPIQLSNESNTSQKNCCAPLSWSAKVASEGGWLSLSQYSGSLPAGTNQKNIFVYVSIAHLCRQSYVGTVTFTKPPKADGSLHSVEIDLDLTSTLSVPPCVAPSQSPGQSSTNT